MNSTILGTTVLPIPPPEARAAAARLDDAFARLGGAELLCHVCKKTCPAHSAAAKEWLSREVCPDCAEELWAASNAECRLKGKS